MLLVLYSSSPLSAMMDGDDDANAPAPLCCVLFCNRYHQLGNAVSPVVAAAVCAAVLKTVGIDVDVDNCNDDGGRCGGAGGGGGCDRSRSMPYLPRGACARREVVRPSLRLLLSATPLACRQHLERQCANFLLASSTVSEQHEPDVHNSGTHDDKDCGGDSVTTDVPLATSGYGSSGFTARDAQLTTWLLQRSTSEAECIAGLTALARAAHYPDVGVVDNAPDQATVGPAESDADSVPRPPKISALASALLDGGLLAAVVRQLTVPASDEAARIAVVTLINLCTVWADGSSQSSPAAATMYYVELVRTALHDDALAALQAMRARAAAGTKSDLRFARQLDRLTMLVRGESGEDS